MRLPAKSGIGWSPATERLITALLFGLSVILGAIGNSLAAPSATPERTVILTAAMFAGAGVILFVAWCWAKGWRLTMDVVSFGIVAIVLVLLVASFFTAEWRS